MNSRLLALVTTTLLASGCAIGPYWDKEVFELPPIKLPAPPAKVYVTGFHTSQGSTYSGHMAGSNVYSSMLKFWGTSSDISFEVADGLYKHGIKTQAVRQFGWRRLQPNEYLLRGFIVDRGGDMDASQWPNVIATCATLLIYGGILPFFYPTKEWTDYHIVVEITDWTGKVVVSVKQDYHCHQRVLWFFGFGQYMTQDRLLELRRWAIEGVAKAIKSSS